MRYLFPISPWNQQRQFEKPIFAFPAHLAMYATYLRNQGYDVVWGNRLMYMDKDGGYNGDSLYGYRDLGDEEWQLQYKHYEPDNIIKDDFQISIPFNQLPYPDRTFTDAKNPRWQKYGNYRWHPATHMMASNLCWWAGAKGCTFCIDSKKIIEGEPQQTRSVAHVIEEIDNLIHLGFREVFDDSGTFPIGKWLEEFCQEMGKNDRNRKIKIGINMKPIKLDFKMMANAGIRFTLVGVESANQETLNRIQKGQHQPNVEKNLKAMADAGLLVHLTSMFGYEWETHEDAMRTVHFIHRMLKKGYVKTAQASVYSPPRTAPDPHSKGHKYIPMIYDVYRNPEFLYRKIRDIKCWEDFTYLLRGGRLVFEENTRKLGKFGKKLYDHIALNK